tara:strand:- start:1713 stop:2378 length:666 start_codon:yes stop_codon:yes gene_type:complete
MVQIVLINKLGLLKETVLKNSERGELYKKAGFRKNDGFEKRTTWSVQLDNEFVCVELWARDEGKAGTENKYDLPPPIDSALYHGTCVLLRCDEDKAPIDLTIKLWTKLYDHLFGGFEDLEEESASEDELAEVPDVLKTRDGYLKDGFICDDGGASDEDEDEEEDESDDTGEECDNIIIDTSMSNHRKKKIVYESEDELDNSWDGNEVELTPEIYDYSSDEE